MRNTYVEVQRKMSKRRRVKRRLLFVFLLLVFATAFLAITSGGVRTVKEAFVKNSYSSMRKSGQYPERMLDALENNEELRQFVLDYPEKKDTYDENITVETDEERGIPLYQQWDPKWGYARYGSGCIGLDGCGPTCLSMVLVGLTGDTSLHPKYVADFSMQNGYVTDTSSTSWSLMTDGARSLGLSVKEVPLSEEQMSQALLEGHPIICTVRPGEFTTTGHFIVLYKYEDGSFYVNDPNSKKRSQKTYSYEQLAPQIKAMWAYEAS